MSREYPLFIAERPYPGEEDLGPKMRVLSERHRKFVWHYGETGGKRSQAVILAGYVPADDQQARIKAWHLLQRQDIQDALRECAVMYMHALAIPALRAAEAIIADPLHKSHGQTVRDILDRAGFMPIQQIEVRHQHTLTVEQKRAKITALAEKHGIDPREFLAGRVVRRLAPPVDAEFVEVQPFENLEEEW